MFFFSKGEDVVANDISAPVVLVVARRLGVVHEIVFPQDACAAFVVVHAPPSVTRAADVVNMVVANDGSELLSEGVNGTEIAEFGPAEVVQMAKLNGVTSRRSRLVTPCPTNA